MKKIAIILILITLLISTISVSGLSIKKNETTGSNDPVPNLYYISLYHNNWQVNSGYTNIFYKVKTENEIGGEVDFEFDWGDGTTSTCNDVSGFVYVNHIYTSSGTFTIKARYVGYSSWSDPIIFQVEDHCDLNVFDITSTPGNQEFRHGDDVTIHATIKNEGTSDLSEPTYVRLFEGPDENGVVIGGPEIITVLDGGPGGGQEIVIDFSITWDYEGSSSQGFWVKVDPVENELDWTELCSTIHPDLNNVDSYHLAPKSKSKDFLSLSLFQYLFERFPFIRELFN